MDSIIFDLDGTLWDSTETVLVAWNNVFTREINHKITIEDLKGIMGLQIKEVGKKLLPDFDEELQVKLMKECCKHECGLLSQKGGRLYDGLEEVLKILSCKYNLYIVSNCQSGYIEAFFKAHKVEQYFLDYENPGRTGLSKGENIKLIIERNNLKNPVYIGDTQGDLAGARVAGIPFVYARYGFGEVNEFDYVIDNFRELLEIFQIF